MSEEQYTFDGLLADLETFRAHEKGLCAHLAALMELPNAPEHLRPMFKLARDAFGPDAAKFLLHPRAHEVEMLLIRIINGICV